MMFAIARRHRLAPSVETSTKPLAGFAGLVPLSRILFIAQQSWYLRGRGELTAWVAKSRATTYHHIAAALSTLLLNTAQSMRMR